MLIFEGWGVNLGAPNKWVENRVFLQKAKYTSVSRESDVSPPHVPV